MTVYAVYDYQIPWITVALSSYKPPLMHCDDHIDIRKFAHFISSTEKDFFHSPPQVGSVGVTHPVLCLWELAATKITKMGAKRAVTPVGGPLRLKMRVNIHAGLHEEDTFVSLLELKAIQSKAIDYEYGIFALIPRKEGDIITLKYPHETFEADDGVLHFGAAFIRLSHQNTPPPNARMTSNGIIRAISSIERGHEIILQSKENSDEHPVDFLDRLVVRRDWAGEFLKTSLGRVTDFVRSSDGSVSYNVTMGLGYFTNQETISQSEIEQRSLYRWTDGQR
jgi:hypothetical protein